jgi:PhzF family phenazine biosynthesis protein
VTAPLVQRFASFADGEAGGNPAGVVVGDALPPAAEMQRIAAELGYSETAFAARAGEGWRVRYFAPEQEVPFCGHATIALGAALALAQGDGVFPLQLNEARITVEGSHREGVLAAALQSPPTRTTAVAPAVLAEALALFGLAADALDPRYPPVRAHAGADHLVLMLRDRAALAGMDYELGPGRTLMTREGWVTILLGWAESERVLHTRNAFAFGGVFEDPATGAATAALAGYLRELGRPAQGHVDVIQGEDMAPGARSLLGVDYGPEPGSSIRVSGRVRRLA